ncbi:MAG: aspartate kinase [Proteobacteria bacterium]|nr:MAG: aspartate kinase [Pseudomonadota bacterium]
MKAKTSVLKFGGSSLASADHIRRVAEQVAGYRRRGDDVLVVASAMGSTTGKLLSLVGEITDDPPLRELDKVLSTGEYVSTALLCMELQRIGVDSVSFSGADCGIRTNNRHFNAAVESIDTRRIREQFAAGRVVVAAGFQGKGRHGEVTTLGLGGSDITAVVLAGALNAARCEICSDVDGVYSADPRVVEDARRIDEISYAEMAELSRHGASVLNARAVEQARLRRVEVYSRSTFEPDSPGTWIRDFSTDSLRIVGVASHDALLPLSFDDDQLPARRAVEQVLCDLDSDSIFADHKDSKTGRRSILIPADRLPDASSFASELKSRHGGHLGIESVCSSVSAIGLGVGGAEHVRNTLRSCSRKAEVVLRHDFAGEHSVTCVVQPDHASKLMNAFHREFDCPAQEAA